MLDDGEECVCVQSISYSVNCKWFRRFVLPGNPALETEIFQSGNVKRCAVCGAAFVPKSNRAKYCQKCAGEVHRKQKAIERALADINPLNVGKKRNEVLALLAKFFPKAAMHMGAMKKYQSTIDYLTQENTSLQKEVDSRKTSISKHIEAAKLRQENEQLQQFISNIPPELMREIQSEQRQQPQKGRDNRD